jgi:hypothetical protein
MHPSLSKQNWCGFRFSLGLLANSRGDWRLSSSLAPTFFDGCRAEDQIGKLGAIAGIRTALNYFLQRETREQ